jgi:hypothetical protein
MSKVPVPDTDGLNIPLTGSVIPCPVHVPPRTLAVRFSGASFSQKGPTGVIFTDVYPSTMILMLSMSLQAPFVIE